MSAGSLRFLTLSQEILSQGYGLRCRTRGPSMFPLLRTGSVIQVEPVSVEKLRPGDVVVYLRPAINGVVAHRLIRKIDEPGRLTLVTRGDSFPRNALENIRPEQVIGMVVAVDWGRGLKMRIDAGPGRTLGIILGRLAPWLRLIYSALGMGLLRRLRPQNSGG